MKSHELRGNHIFPLKMAAISVMTAAQHMSLSTCEERVL